MRNVQLIHAPSILGTEPTGYEAAPDYLLNTELHQFVTNESPILKIPDLNALYKRERDDNGMLNSRALHDYSYILHKSLIDYINVETFPVVLGGDCSLLIGIASSLKQKGHYGLITLDAHADYYLPHQSLTGEAADMEIALITGQGPDIVTNIKGLGPYMLEGDIIHIGQRDQQETIDCGSAQIEDTDINHFPYYMLENNFVRSQNTILDIIEHSKVEGFWLHFDVDVIHDDENPAVYARLPGGLRFDACELLIQSFIESKRIIGMSISIYNPSYDITNSVGRKLAEMLVRLLNRIA